MRPERLIYTFVSYASHYDTPWGQGIAMEGIERTAAVAHRYGIPVTWIVNGGSAPELAELICRWHEEYGDDVIIQAPFFIEDTGGDKALFRQRMEETWVAVKEAFPWVTTKVAGRGKITSEVIEVLGELGFEGMWGYCWEQVWWDGITHKGIPWGSWYVDEQRYKVPHPGKGKIVACEWTARDLNLAYHSGSPCLYSTDPNDVLRAGLCTAEDITYWKHLFRDYLDNTDHNDKVYFLQQQEAHEMEYSDRFRVFPAAHVEACEGMLDRFFAHITQYPITLTTVPAAIRQYHLDHSETAPVYMLTRDTQVRPAVNAYTMTMGGVGGGPWPDTFFYYDKECQMAFVQGECAPRMMRSYIGKHRMSDTFDEQVPQIFVDKYEKSHGQITLTFRIGHWPPMPFGLTYWDELEGYKLAACPDDVGVKLIGGRLVFLRFQLTGEPREITLTLVRVT